MEHQAKKTMKYCRDTTNNHPICRRYPKTLYSLNKLLRKDGAKKDWFGTENVVNLDELEIITKRGGRGDENRTMDFCMGVSVNQKSSQMLMTEIRLNYKKPENIGKKELMDKISYSKTLLTQDIPIAKEKVFLFNDNCISQAKRHIYSLFNNNPNVIVCTTKEFKERFFDNN